MSNEQLENIINNRDYIFKKQLYKVIKDYDLSINELLLLVYFLNQDSLILDIVNISKITLLDNKSIINAYSSLTAKGLIKVDMIKNNGTVSENINLNNLYKSMVADIQKDLKKENTVNIFEMFEKEFGRTLSPMEYEILNAWIASGVSTDIIIGALKEATYNGVSNLRYIDKIIYEWNNKGLKTMKDVDSYMKKQSKNKEEIYFDYNWLDDEE